MKDLNVLNAISLDDFWSQRNPFQDHEGRFDLNGVRLITPGALVPITAVCHALALEGKRPVVAVSESSMRSYLLRSGFFSAVGDIATIEPMIPSRQVRFFAAARGRSPMLLEMTKIANSATLPELLSRIVSSLRTRLRFKRNDASDIGIAISEVCQNTFEHNEHVAGFIAMQVYGTGSNRFVEVAIGDHGVGLATTLKRNPKNLPITSDYHAIRTACRRGTSQFDDPTRGTGLYHLLEIAHKHKGTVQFRSGRAAVRFRMDNRRRWEFRSVQLPGAQISLVLNTK